MSKSAKKQTKKQSISESPKEVSATPTAKESNVAKEAVVPDSKKDDTKKEETKQSKMGYKFFANTGVKVSELCLGAMNFHTSETGNMGLPTSNEADSQVLLDTFVAAGGNFIDTADLYGESEVVIGNWLTKRGKDDARFRESLFIATKAYFPTGQGPNDTGLSRKHVLDAVERSLKRLQTSYIDLYQCHFPDYRTSFREIVSTFHDLIHSGKVRYFGVSNWTGVQVEKAMNIAEKYGWEPIVCTQPQYSLMCRATEWDVIPSVLDHKLACIPWSPLCGGWLTGRYKKNDQGAEKGTRVSWAENTPFKEFGFSQTAAQDRTWKILDLLEVVAKEVGATVAQVALRWVMQREGVTAPIIGPRTLKQLEDNLGATRIKLSDDQMSRLNEASDVPRPYPWGAMWSVPRQ